jgi:hypothetical protein
MSFVSLTLLECLHVRCHVLLFFCECPDEGTETVFDRLLFRENDKRNKSEKNKTGDVSLTREPSMVEKVKRIERTKARIVWIHLFFLSLPSRRLLVFCHSFMGIRSSLDFRFHPFLQKKLLYPPSRDISMDIIMIGNDKV